MYTFVSINDNLPNAKEPYNRGWTLEISSIPQLLLWYSKNSRVELFNVLGDLKSPCHNKYPMSDLMEAHLYKFNKDNKKTEHSLIELCELYDDLKLTSKMNLLNMEKFISIKLEVLLH